MTNKGREMVVDIQATFEEPAFEEPGGGESPQAKLTVWLDSDHVILTASYPGREDTSVSFTQEELRALHAVLGACLEIA